MKKLMTGVVVLGLAAASQAGWTLLDNFDGYATGGIGASPNTTGDKWVGVFDGTGAAYLVDKGAGDKAMAIYGSSGSGGWRGVEANLTSAFGADASLAAGATATYFYQFNATSTFKTDSDGADWDVMMGLTDNVGALDNNNSWQDFAVMPFVAGAAATPALYNDSGTYGTLAVDTWYNVWLVVDNNAKTYDLYTSTGTNDGALTRENAAFVNGKGANALEAIGFMSHADYEMQYDNVFVDLTGVNTTYAIPEPATIGSIVLAGISMLFIRRRFMI